MHKPNTGSWIELKFMPEQWLIIIAFYFMLSGKFFLQIVGLCKRGRRSKLEYNFLPTRVLCALETIRLGKMSYWERGRRIVSWELLSMILSAALPAGWLDLTNKENLLHKRCGKPCSDDPDAPQSGPSHWWNNREWAFYKPVTSKGE